MNSWVFVVPDRSGHPSGGTRYNAALIRELEARGVQVTVLEAAALDLAISVEAEWIWIDSLYLAQVPRLAACARSRGRVLVGLLLHYLPSLLEAGTSNLSTEETDALAACDALVLTSEYMGAALERFGFGSKPRAVVEPGCEFELDRARPDVSTLRALMVAHLVSNKGVYEFLRALAPRLSHASEMTLDIAGSLDIEPDYARRCREVVAEAPTLKPCVAFLGTVRGAALRRLYAERNAFVSASHMESYGMALAEARTMGLPVLAVSGGNVSLHVDARFGGSLCADVCELADSCVELARSAEARASRLALAREAAPRPRPWARVAEEFVARVKSLVLE